MAWLGDGKARQGPLNAVPVILFLLVGFAAPLFAAGRLLVVKPLAASKRITYLEEQGGRIVKQRQGPGRQTVWDLFQELVHFRGVFPHPKLTLEVLLTSQEELRVPGRRRRRRWRNKYDVADRSLGEIAGRHTLRTAADLQRLLPVGVPGEFTTVELAAAAGIPRWLAQKVAYCFRHMQAAEQIGKRGRSHLYRLTGSRRRRAA